MSVRGWMITGFVFMSAAAGAQQGVLLDKSEIRFIFKQMNVPVEGRFTRFTGDIVFDPANPSASRAQISVDLDSIDLGFPEAETEVKRKGWFDTAHTPRAHFVSTRVKNVGPGKFEVAGNLTIKGTTHDILVPFTTHSGGNATIAEGRFLLKRLDYKIGDGAWNDVGVVADDVEVRVKLALGKK